MNLPADVARSRYDVVVFRTQDTYTRGEFFTTQPPLIDRVALGYEMFIHRLPGRVAQRISSACSAGGIASGVAQRYTFVRHFTPPNDPRHFDEDERLQIALGLSRLIRPTSIGLEESAQVWGDLATAESLEIVPGLISGPASEAYVADRTYADWLTVADAESLRSLLDHYFRIAPPDRVKRALWHHEFAARALDMAARWSSVVTGLEALFNTDHRFVGRQFRERCSATAGALGIDLSRADADEAYRLRSKLSHGAVTGVMHERWH
jgi:hypothetical protein